METATHTVFLGEIIAADKLQEETPMTYAYYHKNVKPKPAAKKEEGEKKYVCTICGYVHEGDMPEDFECPICKHGREDFEELA